jgi:uncharacterized membrane protein
MLRRTLYVAYFLEVGLLLVLVPWSSFWERNYFVSIVPPLLDMLRNNYLRGAVSGLGVVNLLVGFFDLSDLLMTRRFGETVSREAT